MLVAALVPACGGTAGPAPTASATATTGGPAPSPSATPSPEPSVSLLPLDPRNRLSTTVSFPSTDGIPLEGRLFGSGHTKGVILSHMGSPRFSQSDWLPVAPVLARHGYLVLTYDFRGVCFDIDPNVGCSHGAVDWPNTWKDLEGAVAFLKTQGATSITLMGASLGGTASLYVASLPDPAVSAVISVSGIEQAEGYDVGPDLLRSIAVPKLLIAGKLDPEAAASYHDWLGARAPATTGLLLDTDLHGTFLFAPLGPADVAFAAAARAAVLRFLAKV
jgi:pimeloyl-ACP methyl ester carboxylesterase